MNKIDKHKRINAKQLEHLGYTYKTAKRISRRYYANFDEWVHFRYSKDGVIRKLPYENLNYQAINKEIDNDG